MKIDKVYNNNVVLAKGDNEEDLVFKKSQVTKLILL